MSKANRAYAVVDVGGTKIQAALVDRSGVVAARNKQPTPRGVEPEPILAAIEDALTDVLRQSREPVVAIGIGVPGVVDPPRGLIVGTPNMGLSDCPIGARLEKRFDLPVALGNDCNLGALGEKWLGSARGANSVMSILVGTGIGGGFVQKSRLWRGAREVASEIGHIVMQIGGPTCGCGNRGCLEALASRSAIERQLREAVAAGRSTILTDLLAGDLNVIRSSVLRQALELKDAVVAEVIDRAAEVLGHACLTVRHLLDPEVIVLGGGVIEACSAHFMPIIQRIVESDRLPAARDGGHVLISSLGDDAVVLGAAALARIHVGDDPFKSGDAALPAYPKITLAGSGELKVGEKTYPKGLYVTVSAKAKSLKEHPIAESDGRLRIETEHLVKPCRGGPELLFLGAARGQQWQLSDAAAEYLRQRAIGWQVLPTDEAVKAFNQSTLRRAAIFYAC
ncbi:MAG: ROK family protein [Pirellulales bacterium]|nr:ROK family protein [Pirellulales bacterium]